MMLTGVTGPQEQRADGLMPYVGPCVLSAISLRSMVRLAVVA